MKIFVLAKEVSFDQTKIIKSFLPQVFVDSHGSGIRVTIVVLSCLC